MTDRLVQAFFAHLLAQNTLSRADQEKGRLRTFLLGSLQNFLINEHERARALKRGGDREILSFDEHLQEAEALISATTHLDDATGYDLTWASSIVKTGLARSARGICGGRQSPVA